MGSRVPKWLDGVYNPGLRNYYLNPNPEFDADPEVDWDRRFEEPEDSNAGNEFTYEEGDERVDEWMDEFPDDIGSGEDPFEFQGDPYDEAEIDRFIENNFSETSSDPSSLDEYDSEDEEVEVEEEAGDDSAPASDNESIYDDFQVS